MQYKDYYKTLGIERNADEDAIKRAYRKLARQFHPDLNKGDKKAEERFKEINEAYEVLSDREKRRMYDQLGSDFRRYQQAGGDPRAYDWVQWFTQHSQARPGANVRVEELDLGDLFAQFFGSGFGQSAAGGFRRAETARSRPRDLEQSVTITLAEAYHGTTRILSRDGQQIEVTIPAGVKTGSKVRVRGQGARNGRGESGDLYLIIEVAPDPTYERQDDDLYRDIKVDVFTAMLGGELKVPTLSGDVMVKIPAGTSSGSRIRLRGKGMPRLSAKGEYGDLYLRVMVTVPTDLTEEERHTLQKMARRRSLG
ncbi:MAG: DnaJ C-terminal domain-containing protein [Candidatus Roseilinea sp.]|uniref:DnaJ C-terminal domain-containing protein n=1 Tax=Candidatus Roseilinea sp. TaxID=2838777 RepID=UPI00404B59FF